MGAAENQEAEFGAFCRQGIGVRGPTTDRDQQGVAAGDPGGVDRQARAVAGGEDGGAVRARCKTVPEAAGDRVPLEVPAGEDLVANGQLLGHTLLRRDVLLVGREPALGSVIELVVGGPRIPFLVAAFHDELLQHGVAQFFGLQLAGAGDYRDAQARSGVAHRLLIA